MTEKEAKELLPIITAFAEGKRIEVKGSYGEWVEVISPDFGNGPKNYRIKSVPKYRPFNNAEECWQEMQKHQPFGWIKFRKQEDGYIHFETIRDAGIYFDSLDVTFKEAFDYYTFIDDSPFGIKEE